MRLLPLGLLVLLLGLTQAAPPVEAHTPTPDELEGVEFEQRLGQPVPLDADFLDESGRLVKLEDYLAAGPVILTLNYLSCPNLCPLILESLATSLNAVPFTLGDKFTVLTVSIDPRDTSEQAATARHQALRQYQRPEGARGWHVLTGRQEQIDRLTTAVGFHYRYDPERDEYAHPAGLVLLTPDGRISRYLYGLDYPPNDLRLALVEASQQRIGTLVDQVLLACYHYDAQQGRYTPIVLGVVRGAGVVTVLGLGGLVGLLWRAERRRPDRRGPEET